MLGLDFSCYFHTLFTLCTLQNSRVKALCLWKKSLLVEKSKAEECPWLMERKKQVQRGKEEY